MKKWLDKYQIGGNINPIPNDYIINRSEKLKYINGEPTSNYVTTYDTIARQDNGYWGNNYQGINIPPPLPIDKNGKVIFSSSKGTTKQHSDVLVSRQNGGEIIQDDNGYWNKENWGKPVQINSGDITMRGINVPLQAISDLGEHQLMLPGQDYHFQGKHVLEVPIAQNGDIIKQNNLKKIKDNYAVDPTNQIGYEVKNNELYLDNTTLPNSNEYTEERKWLRNWMRNRPSQFENLNTIYNNAHSFPSDGWFTKQEYHTPESIKNQAIANSTLVPIKTHKGVLEDAYVDYDSGYSPFQNQIYLSPTSETPSTAIHELTHSTRLGNLYSRYSDIDNKIKNDPKFKSVDWKKVGEDYGTSDPQNYFGDPNEVYSRIMQIRYENKLDPKKKYTVDDVKKLKHESTNLFDFYSPETIKYLLNSLVLNQSPQKTQELIPIAQNGISQQNDRNGTQLGQLTDFSNKQNKNNWLQKYS